MTALAITVTAEPDEAARQAIGEGLGGYNRAAHGPLPRQPRWILARDADGIVQAGAKCELAWQWLHVDWLWVGETLRRQGWGGRLLAAAEALAREEGSIGLHLTTWSFQAPDFYRKQGFTEIGRAPDMPPGVTRHWFAKRLDGGKLP